MRARAWTVVARHQTGAPFTHCHAATEDEARMRARVFKLDYPGVSTIVTASTTEDIRAAKEQLAPWVHRQRPVDHIAQLREENSRLRDENADLRAAFVRSPMQHGLRLYHITEAGRRALASTEASPADPVSHEGVATCPASSSSSSSPRSS